MSEKQTMFRIYEQFATKLSSNIINEGIENSVPKIPKLLNNLDIEFLMKQFDRRDWAQAMKKRYDMLFHYLVVLDELRKEVVDHHKDKELSNAQAYFDQPQFRNISKWAKQRKVKEMADAAAKARATKLFPAGQPIDAKFIRKQPEFRLVDKDDFELFKDKIDKINNYYLSNKPIEFRNFVTGSESTPRSYKASPYLADLAKSIEGEFGKADGFDLHNAKRISRSKNGQPIEPKYITDGFVFPTKKEIEDSIRSKLKDISRGVSVPTDADDENRLMGHFPKREKLVSDEGTSPLEKQLVNVYMPKARENLEAQKKARPTFHYKESDVRKEAARLARLKIKNYTVGQFADFLKNQKGVSQSDVAGIEDVFPNTTIEGVGDKDFIKQKNRKTDIPHQKVAVTRIVNGEEQQVFVDNPVLNKTIMYRDVKLEDPHDLDSKDLTSDNTQTNLHGRGLGEKTFDPILFDRLFARWKALRDPKTNPLDAAKIEKILNTHGLSKTSPLKNVVDAAKRFFYQEARASEYRQGSDVSATFSHHPLRMSAESKYMNRFHNQADYDEKMNTLMVKGNRYKSNGTTFDLHKVIKRAVDRFVTPRPNMPLGQALPRLLMGRSRTALYELAQDRVLGDLGNEALYMNVGTDQAPNWYGNATTISRLVGKEMKRYFDQNLLAGSARGRGNFIQILDKEVQDLSCKQGSRYLSPGECLFGNDIKANRERARQGISDASNESAGGGGGIVQQRRKIYRAIQGTLEMMQALYELMKTKSALVKNRTRMLQLQTDLQKLTALPADKKTPTMQKQIADKTKEMDSIKNQSREEAIYEITKFFQDNISLNKEAFLNAFVNKYQTELNDVLRAGEKFQIPADLASEDPMRKNQLTTPEKYQAKLDAKKAVPYSGNLDAEMRIALENNNIDKVIELYKKQADARPTFAKKLMTQLLLQIPNPIDQSKFSAAVAKFNRDLDIKLRNHADPDYVGPNLMGPFIFWNTKDLTGLEMLKKFQDNLKYLSRSRLVHLAARMSEYYYYDAEKEGAIDPFGTVPTPPGYFQSPAWKKWKSVLKANDSYRRKAMALAMEEIQKRNLYEKLVNRFIHPERFEKMIDVIDAEARPPKKKAGRPRKNPLPTPKPAT